MSRERDITALLRRARDGDENAMAELLPIVYGRLKELAAAKMRKAAPNHILQTTALVHEAYLRALGDDHEDFENRRHFYYIAARAMRDILVEDARKNARAKRGGDRVKVSTSDFEIAVRSTPEELLALDEALGQLEAQSPRRYELVLLKFFVGLSTEEAARALGVGVRTVERDWHFVRAYLHGVMESGA